MLSGSHAPSSLSGPPATTDAPAAPSERAVLARRILLEALFLGGLGDSLLHEGPGIGLFLWAVAFTITVVRLISRRGESIRREQIGWMLVILVFGSFFAWRNSADLLFYDFAAMVGAALLLAATLGASLADSAPFSANACAIVAGALVFAVKASVERHRSPRARERHRRAERLVSGSRARWTARDSCSRSPCCLSSVFCSPSPIRYSDRSWHCRTFGVDVIASHLFIAGFVTWATAGWLQGAFATVAPTAARERQPSISLGTLDLTAILGGLVALFGAFVAVQVGWLFGGERLVRSTTGLGYAEYARHGFFELVWVSLLVLPVLLGTRALIRDADTAAVRRHKLLAAPLLVLVGGVMASALGRMALYVHYYGPSTARLYASVFMGWLAIVFAWFGLTVLRGRTRDFAAGMTITGFLTLAGLNLVNPEALVARASIDRAGASLLVRDSISASPLPAGAARSRILSHRLSLPHCSSGR